MKFTTFLSDHKAYALPDKSTFALHLTTLERPFHHGHGNTNSSTRVNPWHSVINPYKQQAMLFL